MHPPSLEVLRGFPRRLVTSGWRLHRQGYEPDTYVRFPSRFMPVGIVNIGVIYLATSATNALAEVVDPHTVVASTFFEGRILSKFNLSGLEFADLDSPKASAFGLSDGISRTPDYSWGQEWATAFVESGFDGITYLSNRLPGETIIALFRKVGKVSLLEVISENTITSKDLELAGISTVTGSITPGLDPL
ncbi:RES family NAD+ phosphorylase [Arthrobacter alpinus]|nr:RES family NAD+ phosphorylase [Arthrobacter alpinus]